jgi:hypothetical protein
MRSQLSDQQSLSLRTVDELRLNDAGEPQTYHIADYQRGFRWSPLQVTQLLDDILDFTERDNPQPDEFYCLQPLVLKVAKAGYEVVDGQQRLTTLLLILRHFNERLTEKYRQPLYALEYHTRPHLREFLDDPTSAKADDNADFFHLYHAVRAIEDWFESRASKVEDIKSALLNKTKVIWYQIADADNPVEAFTRLNVGKIPLTNDELIRALFLKRESDNEAEADDLQRQIANEWDQIEKALQSPDFWYFISNDESRQQNRIGFLFDLVARADGLTAAEERDDYGIFHAFNRRLSTEGATTKLEWRRIKNAYMTLEEWFDDRTLYHVIGFLVHEGFRIQELRELAEGCTKDQFEARIWKKAFKHVIGAALPKGGDLEEVRSLVSEQLEELTYGKPSDHRKIRSLLLLFNIATLLSDHRSTIRFQFDSFKTESWDIEHVRSVAPDRLRNHSEQTEWLGHSLEYLRSQGVEEALCNRIQDYLALAKQDASEDKFESLYQAVVAFFSEKGDEPASDTIGNLVLLDQATNRSYKNAVFAVKRQRLLSLDRAGIFVPLCTRNVFLKCYSDTVDHLIFWDDADRAAYQKVILDTLVHFFTNTKGATK